MMRPAGSRARTRPRSVSAAGERYSSWRAGARMPGAGDAGADPVQWAVEMSSSRSSPGSPTRGSTATSRGAGRMKRVLLTPARPSLIALRAPRSFLPEVRWCAVVAHLRLRRPSRRAGGLSVATRGMLARSSLRGCSFSAVAWYCYRRSALWGPRRVRLDLDVVRAGLAHDPGGPRRWCCGCEARRPAAAVPGSVGWCRCEPG